MRVLRVYHAGRDAAQRQRERALVAAGADVTLVVPEQWPGTPPTPPFDTDPFPVVPVPVDRPGDVNRHRFADPTALTQLIASVAPDVLDVHEEPVSLAAHQLLELAPAGMPVVMYTAQNLDKRFPPPFSRWERQALGRVQALYPCSRQAASVARGKGFAGAVHVLPLGVDHGELTPGTQDPTDDEVTLLLAGRLVPEKGVLDAVQVLARICEHRPARLVLVGRGPLGAAALAQADRLGVRAAVEVRPWLTPRELAGAYRQAHVVLVPSHSTPRWVEQFGRVIVEAQACGAVVAGYASGSIPEVLGDTGICVPEGDLDALAAAVSDVLEDPGRWAALREAGRRRLAGLGWDSVAAGMVRMYEAALAAPARPTGSVRGSDQARVRALAEFGPPASAAGQRRPFAVPVLRSAPRAAALLGAGLDRAGALAARGRR